MATMALSASSMSSSAKESLLLSHMETTDEWAGWCTVESEPVCPPKYHRRNGIGNIQSIALGYRSFTSSNTRNLHPRPRIFRINKVLSFKKYAYTDPSTD